MKKTISISFLLLLCVTNSYCQEIGISIHKFNYLITGLDNPIDIVVENEECDSLIIKWENGEFEGKGCNYVINPVDVGVSVLKIYIKSSVDTILIGERELRINPLPHPTALISNRSGGKIRVNEFKAQLGIHTTFENFDINVSIPISRFRVIIIRGNGLEGIILNTGGKFEIETIELLQNIEIGDQVYFVDIYCRIPGKSDEIKLKSIDFIIE